MKKGWIRGGCCLAVLVQSLFGAASLRAQEDNNSPQQMLENGTAAFKAGDYAAAARDLSVVIQKIAPGPVLEPIYFTLGAAYFNLKDYPTAIATFQNYVKLYPQGARIDDVNFSFGEAQLLTNHPEEAEKLFAKLRDNPAYREKAILLSFEADKKMQKPGDAIQLLEAAAAQPNSPKFAVRIHMELAALYIDQGLLDKAAESFRFLETHAGDIENPLALNSIAVKLGDKLLAAKKTSEALGVYRMVCSNEQAIAVEQQRIADLQAEIAANQAQIKDNPLQSPLLRIQAQDDEQKIEDAKKAIEVAQKAPPVLPAVYFRIGVAYAQGGQWWEAAVVYRKILGDFPQSAVAEPALYSSAILFYQLKQVERAQGLCDAYLKQYPQGRYVNDIAFFRGAIAFEAKQYDQGVADWRDLIKNQPDNPRREQVEFLLGNIMVGQRKFDDAIAAYKQYLKDYPKGKDVEEAEYRSALALLFSGQADPGMAAIRAYQKKYPSGTFMADADYRLAIAKLGLAKNPEEIGAVIADCKAWQQKYGTNGPLAQVLTLQGDAYVQLHDDENAAQSYMAAYQAATTDDVIGSAPFEAAKILQKEGKWPEITALFEGFVKNHPDHPSEILAISWIGKADIKQGRIEAAKQFLAQTAQQYLTDPSREAVDEILTQLAQLDARSTEPKLSSLAPAAPPSSAPAFPPPPAADPVALLNAMLTIPDLDEEPTARARILYADAELMRFLKKPDARDALLLRIGKEFHPEDLSPALLAQVGDALLRNGRLSEAQPFFAYLNDEYGQSPLAEAAYKGLGEIAYDNKDYPKALKWYSDALDKGIASSLLKEITVGKARALLAMGDYDKAKALFEEIASNRQWHGDATALSVYSLGQIEFAQQHWPEANALFQRVYVGYQKYPDIQAKAYLASGECFEKLGQSQDAINTYSEMLHKPENARLAAFPETEQARQRLQALAPNS